MKLSIEYSKRNYPVKQKYLGVEDWIIYFPAIYLLIPDYQAKAMLKNRIKINFFESPAFEGDLGAFAINFSTNMSELPPILLGHMAMGFSRHGWLQ